MFTFKTSKTEVSVNIAAILMASACLVRAVAYLMSVMPL
jgi:hypothetical protein